jgi:hypothetical protein
MAKQSLRANILRAGVLVSVVIGAQADEVCVDKEKFEKNGWQLTPVQQGMDAYLRDHRMRVNWLKEPRPPSAVGRDYYEWLWINEFGATMKSELVQRFCGGATDSGAEE